MENEELKRALFGRSKPSNDMELLLDIVCRTTRLTKDRVLSVSRDREGTIARFVFSHIAHRDLHLTSREIAPMINRDGSSVRHGVYEMDYRLHLGMQPETKIYKEVKNVFEQERQDDIEVD